MGKIIRNGIEYSGSYDNAISINYDNTNSGLNATTVQEGIDEIKEDLKPHANVNPIANLLTTETGYALDATQGKVLDDKIASITNSLNDMLIVRVVSFKANFDSTFHVAEGYVEIPYSGYTPLTANVHHAGSSDIYPYSFYVSGNNLYYGLKSTSLTGEVNASAMVVYLKSEFLSN